MRVVGLLAFVCVLNCVDGDVCGCYVNFVFNLERQG